MMITLCYGAHRWNGEEREVIRKKRNNKTVVLRVSKATSLGCDECTSVRRVVQLVIYKTAGKRIGHPVGELNLIVLFSYGRIFFTYYFRRPTYVIHLFTHRYACTGT